MNESNLAIVFSPTLKLSNDAVASFVADYDTIFDNADLPPLPPTWPEVEFGKLYVPDTPKAPAGSPAAAAKDGVVTAQLIDLGDQQETPKSPRTPKATPPPPPPPPAGGRHHHHKPPSSKPLPQIPQKQLPPPPPPRVD